MVAVGARARLFLPSENQGIYEYLDSAIFPAQSCRREEDKPRLFYVELELLSSQIQVQRNGGLTDGK